MRGRIYPSSQMNDKQQDISHDRVVHFDNHALKTTERVFKPEKKLIGRKKKVRIYLLFDTSSQYPCFSFVTKHSTYSRLIIDKHKLPSVVVIAVRESPAYAAREVATCAAVGCRLLTVSPLYLYCRPAKSMIKSTLNQFS